MAKALINLARNENYKRNNTPQTEKAREDQVRNNAGGFVFAVSDSSRLERFLILGTDGGTYYVGEQKHTDQNVKFLRDMVKKDERFVVDTIVDVSFNGRAVRQSPALFALAVVLTEGQDKAYAREAFNKVVRTSTHLFEIAEYIDNLGGWGRAKRKAFANWYESKEATSLAYQAVKYRQRNGWTHRDVLRLSHAKPDSSVANFMLGKEIPSDAEYPVILTGFAEIQAAGSEKEVLDILNRDMYKNLPWEAIPTQFLKSEKVWKTLFYNGQLNGQALVRNITRLARIDAFKDMKFAGDYAERLTDEEMIAKTRLHPINFLNAMVVHQDGQIDRRNDGGYYWSYGQRKKDWTTNPRILDALNEGFHLAFKSVQPAGKRTMIGLDVSGSMGQDANGLDLSCAQVGAAVAMTIARTEPYYAVMGFSNIFKDLGITAKMGLNDVLRRTSNMTFGATDCALPMQYALRNRIEVDTFVIVTDNETWFGGEHPFQALKKYRNQMGIDARLAVLGVAGSEFSIADGNDRGTMDFVGFDSNAPRVLADFSAGRL